MEMLTLRVPEEKKQEWDDYHKRPDTDPRNRTDLIEQAVTLYIERDEMSPQGQFAESERLNNLEASVASLESAMEDIGQDLREVKRHLAHPDADLKELAHDAMKVLPPMDAVDMARYGEAVMPSTEWAAGEAEPDPANIPDVPLSAHEIRRYIEESGFGDYQFALTDGDVEDALAYLHDQHLATPVDDDRWVKDT